MRYEIDQNTFAITVFVETQEPPVLFQPFWPDGTEWGSLEEAEAWASQYVKAANNWQELFPPSGPGEEPTPQPEPIAPAPEQSEE